MIKHELKIWPEYFERVLDGSKTFEVRENGRGFQKGDSVTLREFNPAAKEADPVWDQLPSVFKSIDHRYTGRVLEFKIGYVYPINEAMVVFSLLKE